MKIIYVPFSTCVALVSFNIDTYVSTTCIIISMLLLPIVVKLQTKN